MKNILSFFLFLCFASTLAIAQSHELTKGKNLNQLIELAKRFEVKPRPEPDWARTEQPPLATIAWLSDMHLGSSKGAEGTVKIALNQLRDEIRPDLTLFTGDNNAIFDKNDKGPIDERRQKWLKRFIETELNLPYAIIPGDNWPWDFERVFGSPTRSFDFKGIHFILTATDSMARTNDSCAIFFKDTKKWLQQDLIENKDKPCFLVIHETAFPPAFLDAPWLDGLMTRHQSALAVLSGHIHMDLEFKRNGYTQFVCPAMGPVKCPSFKMLQIHPNQIIIRSYELADGKFALVSKWQRIAIPSKLRKDITAEAPSTITNLKTMPERPKVLDNSLAKRAKEIDMALFQAGSNFGIMKLLGK